MKLEKSVSNIARIENAWVFIRHFTLWLEIISSKYALRKKLQKQTTKYLRIIYVTFWALGKFISHNKIRRAKQLMKYMKTIVKARKDLWRFKRWTKAKNNIRKFVVKYEGNPQFLLFVKFVVDRLTKIQKLYRRYYIKKTIMLSLMNIQWSAIEFAILNIRKGTDLQESDINNAIKEGRMSNAVPVNIRILYIKDFLKVFFVVK